MTAHVSRKWVIECRAYGGELEWSQKVIGTRGEAEMALQAYRDEGRRLGLSSEVRLTGGHALQSGGDKLQKRFHRRREAR